MEEATKEGSNVPNSVVFRGISLILIGIPVVIIASFFIVIPQYIIGIHFVIDVIGLSGFMYSMGVFFGWVGLILKSILSPYFSILKKHWQDHTRPSGSIHDSYSQILRLHLSTDYGEYPEYKFLRNFYKKLLFSMKVFLAFWILAWVIFIVSLYANDFYIGVILNGLISTITYMSPIDIFTDRFLVAEQVQFIVNFTLLPTSYFVALSLENLARFLEWKIWLASSPKSQKEYFEEID